jgi:hypothetical protein
MPGEKDEINVSVNIVIKNSVNYAVTFTGKRD